MSRDLPRRRNAYRWWHRVSLRWADNDAYGHVNNAIHYQWFDSAVNQWLVEAGLLDIEAGDPIGLVVETGCRYLSSLAYPGAVEVGLALQNVGTSSVTYRLGVFAEGADGPAAEGHFTHVYVSRDSRRPVPLPAAWRDRIAELA